MAKWKRKGYQTINPHLSVSDIDKAVAFYEMVFDAEEISRLPGPGGTGTMLVELEVGESMLTIGKIRSETGEFESHQESHYVSHPTCLLNIYVEDVDKVFEHAKAAGCTVKKEPTDMFWGDRVALIEDLFGHRWSISTQKERLSEKEIRERAQEFYLQKSKS
jgi:PhnB protein